MTTGPEEKSSGAETRIEVHLSPDLEEFVRRYTGPDEGTSGVLVDALYMLRSGT